jgi:site-specific DNA-methyltransferase (cytosine-N4-specific)
MTAQAPIYGLWPDLTPAVEASDWTFNGASTRAMSHCYHDYPARMIPQIAGRLLDRYGADAKLLFDPYAGTGTSLVEGLVRGINVIGTDLNPLARLIAKAKTARPDTKQVDNELARFDKFIMRSSAGNISPPVAIDGISRLDFWFKPDVIKRLAALKNFIADIEDEAVRLFFQVAFSETVRESSNTRNTEFKLYRYEAEKLKTFAPNVFGIMSAKLRRNRIGLQGFLVRMEQCASQPQADIYDFNTVVAVPGDKIAAASIDIVVTSPPYGDSHTTVAYGQYSRLSAAWLGLKEPAYIDRALMGGISSKQIPDFPSVPLNQALERIRQADKKRAFEVASFYADLQISCSNIAPLICPNGHVCYVVGNRKVKGVVLPTDDAIRCFFAARGFTHVATFHRTIPNKRMPLRNSPTNAAGNVENTMTQEHIIVLRKSPNIS